MAIAEQTVEMAQRPAETNPVSRASTGVAVRSIARRSSSPA